MNQFQILRHFEENTFFVCHQNYDTILISQTPKTTRVRPGQGERFYIIKTPFLPTVLKRPTPPHISQCNALRFFYSLLT